MKQIEDNKGELGKFESFSLETFFRFYASSLGDSAASKLYELTMKDIESLLKKAIDRAVDVALPNEKFAKQSDLVKKVCEEFGINTGGEK